jgi:hypothetical protein
VRLETVDGELLVERCGGGGGLESGGAGLGGSDLETGSREYSTTQTVQGMHTFLSWKAAVLTFRFSSSRSTTSR